MISRNIQRMIGPPPKDFAVLWPGHEERRKDPKWDPKRDVVHRRTRELLWYWRNLPKNKFDLCVVLSGAERIGKSTLAIMMLEILDPKFDVQWIRFKNRAFIDMGRSLGPARGRLHDEGPFSRDAMTDDNKDLAEHVFRCGQLYLYNFMIKPSLRWFEPVIKEHRAAFWILVTDRGEALIHSFRRADYPGAKPGWNKMFTVSFPEYHPVWEPEYLAMKRVDLYPDEATGEVQGHEYPALTPDGLAGSFHRLMSKRERAKA